MTITDYNGGICAARDVQTVGIGGGLAQEDGLGSAVQTGTLCRACCAHDVWSPAFQSIRRVKALTRDSSADELLGDGGSHGFG